MQFLRQIRVSKPCDADWDAMSGDDAKRFCDKCQKHVHNLTELTEAEAAVLFAEDAPTPCVRYQPQKDGSPIYRGSQAWKALIALGAMGGVAAACDPPLTGDVAMPMTKAHTAQPSTLGKIAAPGPTVTGSVAPPVLQGKPARPDVKKPVPTHLTGRPSRPRKP